MSKNVTAKTDDGGYYAIKGFLYQFDKALIEVLNNPQSTIAFENRQDIDYEDFVLQVKHKETQDYSHSKVRSPVEGLMELFSQDTTKRLCLYCYFRDRRPADWRLTLTELDSVISEGTKTRYPESLRKHFCNCFTIRFSEDYENQFEQTVALIKSSFHLQQCEAILYHSIFRSKLLERSLLPKTDRHVSLQDLRNFLEDAEVTVFQRAYSKYLATAKYAKLIKTRYFTLTEPNIENFERLFLVECDSLASQVDLSKIAGRVARKFRKKGKSPQPYIIFRRLPDDELKELKRALFDQGTRFFDGTHFDGDRFRLDELAGRHLDDDTFTLKVVSDGEMLNLVQRVKLKEVFQFFIETPVNLDVRGKHCRIQIEKTEQVLQMIT